MNYYDPDGREKVNVRIFIDKDIYNAKYEIYDSAMDYYEDAKEYVQKDGGIVSLNTIGYVKTLSTYWNGMSWNSINVLAIFAHGSPNTVIFGGEALTPADIYRDYDPYNPDEIYFGEIHLDLLILSVCNAGHYDSYLSDKSNNIAYAFSVKITNSVNGSTNTSMVLASDGTITVDSYAQEYEYLASVPDGIWSSDCKNGRKKQYGWILFTNGKKEEWDEFANTGNEKVLYSVGSSHYYCEVIDFDSTIKQLKKDYSLKWTLKMYK